MKVVIEIHAAIFLVLGNIGIDIKLSSTDESKPRGIQPAGTILRSGGRPRVPSLLDPPQRTHPGAAIQGKGKTPAIRHHRRGILKRLLQSAGMVEGAP